MTKSKRYHDKGSRCLKAFTVSKGSQKYFFTLTKQLRSFTEQRHNLWAIEGSLIVNKKMVYVDLCFVGFYQDLA